jgi:hypothetical protein
MEVNIIKLAFLLSYLTMLICLVSGVPFMTAMFRSIILMVIFCATGLALRWYLLKMITSLQLSAQSRGEVSDSWETTEQETPEETVEETTFAPVEDSNLPTA